MIGILKHNNSLYYSVNYNVKHESEIIDTHNLIGETATDAVVEMHDVQKLFEGRALNKTGHIILSPSIADGQLLTHEQWQDIGNAYLRKMKMEELQSITFLHSDKGHKHLHIVVNKINHEGKIWNSTNDQGEHINPATLSHRVADSIAQEMNLVRASEVMKERERERAINPESYLITEPLGVMDEVEQLLQRASLEAWKEGDFKQDVYLSEIKSRLAREDKGRTLVVAYPYNDETKPIKGFSIVMEDGKKFSASDIGREYTLQQQSKASILCQWKQQIENKSIKKNVPVSTTERPAQEATERPTQEKTKRHENIRAILDQATTETWREGQFTREAFQTIASEKLQEQGYTFHAYNKDQEHPERLTGYGVKYGDNREDYVSSTSFGREYNLSNLERARPPSEPVEIDFQNTPMDKVRGRLNKDCRSAMQEISRGGGKAIDMIDKLKEKGYAVKETYNQFGEVVDFKVEVKQHVSLNSASIDKDLRLNNIATTILVNQLHDKGQYNSRYLESLERRGYGVSPVIDKNTGKNTGYSVIDKDGNSRYMTMSQVVYEDRQLVQQIRREAVTAKSIQDSPYLQQLEKEGKTIQAEINLKTGDKIGYTVSDYNKMTNETKTEFITLSNGRSKDTEIIQKQKVQEQDRQRTVAAIKDSPYLHLP